MEADGLCAVLVVNAGNLDPACADDFILWNRQLHVESTEICKELCRRVELVTIPGALPPHPNLREPLCSHEEVALVTGARQYFAELVVELNSELNRFAGGYRSRQFQLKNSMVVRIAVVGRDELHVRGEVAHTHNFERLNFRCRSILFIPLKTRMIPPQLGHEC